MLEFIVLGIVPGTQFQLSPMGVVLLWVVFVSIIRTGSTFFGARRLLRKYKLIGTYYTIIAKKHRITRQLNSSFHAVKLQEEYSDRTVATPPASIVVHP